MVMVLEARMVAGRARRRSWSGVMMMIDGLIDISN